MQRKTVFVEDEFYHLYNRGVDKRVIFSTTQDYKRFMALLYLANSAAEVRIGNLLRDTPYEDLFTIERGEPLVALGAFCLMPNHFHLLATPLVENGIPRYMLKVQTGYSMYFNIKNERSGSLFQGPFKSQHAGKDTYLKYLFSYIHLNPAKLKDAHWKEKSYSKHSSLTKFIEQYPYSSLDAYLHGKHMITSPTPFPDYFSSPQELKNHIADWFTQNNSEQGLPLLKV